MKVALSFVPPQDPSGGGSPWAQFLSSIRNAYADMHRLLTSKTLKSQVRKGTTTLYDNYWLITFSVAKDGTQRLVIGFDTGSDLHSLNYEAQGGNLEEIMASVALTYHLFKHEVARLQKMRDSINLVATK